MAATLHDINHNAGGAVTNFWDSETDPSGGVAVKVAAGLNGTANGLAMDMTVNDTMRVDSVWTPPASNKLKFSCYLDPNGNSQIAQIDIFYAGIEDVGNVFLFQLAIENEELNTDISLRVAYGKDGSTSTNLPGGGVISDAEHLIEVEIIRETNATSNDGEARWWLDSVLKGEATDVKNFDLFASADEIYAEVSGDVGGGGDDDFYYDEILITDNASNGTLTLAAMTKPAAIDAAGEFIYLALLEGGTPILTKISIALDSDGTTVFDPGAGDNIGVECGRFNSDIVWVAGNFDGTNVVEKSEDGGSTFTVKDGAGFGDVRTFVMGPDSDDRILVFDETNGDILETRDDGTSWDTINASVTPEVNAIARLGKNVQESVFGNDGGANNSINYSVNSGDDLEDFQTGVFPNENVTRVIIN